MMVPVQSLHFVEYYSCNLDLKKNVQFLISLFYSANVYKKYSAKCHCQFAVNCKKLFVMVKAIVQ